MTWHSPEGFDRQARARLNSPVAPIADDPRFGEARRALIEAVMHEAALTTRGRAWFAYEYGRWLDNRRKIDQHAQRARSLLERPVESPVFIAGLPRTGTTLLHRLLSQDPQWRAPALWEMLTSPDVDGEHINERVELAKRWVRSVVEQAPAQQKMHYLDPMAPEECYLLLQNSFMSYATSFEYNIPSYERWLLSRDRTPAYRDYRAQLQRLSRSRQQGRWLLKDPEHILALDTILKVFPSATIIQTHRDPGELTSSLCSLQHLAQSAWSKGAVPRARYGERVLERWSRPTRRMVRARGDLQGGQIYDVRFDALCTHAMRVVEEIYEYLGWELSAAARVNMTRWLAKNPRHGRGHHNHSTEEFGLSREQIRRAFSDYLEFFHTLPLQRA